MPVCDCIADRRRLAPPYLLLLLILLGLNPYLTDQKNQITSDLPFLLFVYTALLFADTSKPAPELLPGCRARYWPVFSAIWPLHPGDRYRTDSLRHQLQT